MSDLHLEVGQQYAAFQISPRASYLILAGDIGRLADYTPYRDFLRSQCDQFTQVYLILGNHEFFGVSRREGLRLAQALQDEPGLKGKLFVLNRKRVDMEGSITILGCTLQSFVPQEARETVRQKINDFRRIEDWTVADHVAEHTLDVAWLKGEIKAIRGDENEHQRRIVVVVTHHAPSTRGTSKPTDENNPWSSAFGTDLLGQVDGCLDDVQWWVFGHTHYSTEFSRGGIKLVSNQRGYVLPGKEDHKAESRGLLKSVIQKLWADTGPGQHTFDVGRTIQV
ncbi:MAG: hypothetical protein M1837_006801 [Sclerophora amabilis]|nr:MAG: hypothetical protein M1837_006801 [Sclerophora amabilis]